MLSRNKILLICSALFIAAFAKGQEDAFTKAYRFVTTDNTDSARYYIDISMKEKNSKQDPMVWFLKGLIYKDLYKKYERGNTESSLRNDAVFAIQNSIAMDSAKEYYTNNKNILLFLASTYYNDAATNLDTLNYKTSIKCFENYIKLFVTIDTSKENLNNSEIKFQIALATIYTQIYDNDRKNRLEYLNLAKNSYNKVLSLDPNNISANYNMGILYYNQAAALILQQDFDIDIIALNDIQDNSINLFKESLPFMEKAYQLNPTRKETLMGLSGIYFSLNEFEKSKVFQKKLEEVQKQEK